MPEEYQKAKLINKNQDPAFTLEEIKQDIKQFFSEHLNFDMKKIKDDSLIIEDLNVDSIIIAEIFVYIQDKYGINVDEEFMLGNSLSISEISKMIVNKI